MGEKMLITQALDERDLLVKKINDKIAKASFVDTVRTNEERVYHKRISREDFARQAGSASQQIRDLITRFEKIDAAIVASNAAAMIPSAVWPEIMSCPMNIYIPCIWSVNGTDRILLPVMSKPEVW